MLFIPVILPPIVAISTPIIIAMIWKLLIIIFKKNATPVKGDSLGVLGMQGAGKTQFYKTLKGEEYSSSEATSVDDYPEFEFIIDDKKVMIQAGRDIGGGEEYIRIYEDFIKEKDIIVFVFDIAKYLNDSEYKEEVNKRLHFIWKKLGAKESNKNEGIKSKYIIFGSHLDQLPIEKWSSIYNEVIRSIQEEQFRDMLNNNFFLADLRDQKKLFQIIKKTNIFDELNNVDTK